MYSSTAPRNQFAARDGSHRVRPNIHQNVVSHHNVGIENISQSLGIGKLLATSKAAVRNARLASANPKPPAACTQSFHVRTSPRSSNGSTGPRQNINSPLIWLTCRQLRKGYS